MSTTEIEIRSTRDPRPEARVLVQDSNMHPKGEGVFVLVSNGTDSAGAWLNAAEAERLIDAVADSLGRPALRVRRPLVEGKRYVVLSGFRSGDGSSAYRLSEGEVVTLSDRDPDSDGDVEVDTSDGFVSWVLPEYLAPATTEETTS